MKKYTLLFLTSLLSTIGLSAQSVPVSASHLGFLKPITGTITWTPALSTNISSGGGQTTILPVTVPVTAGAFSLTLPDGLLANPSNICYIVTVHATNGASALGPGYTCVQVHGTSQFAGDWCAAGSCNFDNFIPDVSPLAVQVAGPAGPNLLSNTTVTTLNGVLKGNGSTVGVALGSDIPNITESQVTNLVSDLAGKQPSLGFTAVPNTETVNGHALSSNITLSASDLSTGTLPHAQLPALLAGDIPNITESQVTNLVSDLAAKVPTTTNVNSHALSANVTLGFSDLAGSLPHSQLPTLLAGDIPNLAESQVTNLVSDLAAKVPTSTTVNGHALSGNVVVSASDLNTGTLPHAQLPSLVSGDIPNNAANTSGSAASLSSASALPNGTTGTTQSALDNSTKVATTAYAQSQAYLLNSAPAWLEFLGTGSDGANTTASGALSGVFYYTNFTVPFGNTVTTNSKGLIIHATGTCTIAGSIVGNGVGQAAASNGYYGGSGGGSGGGTSGGAAGPASFVTSGGPNSFGATTFISGGNAGASSGGNGSNSSNVSCNNGVCSYQDVQRMSVTAGGSTDTLGWQGAPGAVGANSGGAAGKGGSHVTLMCAQITGTDGTHTGVIDVSGSGGSPSAANSTGAGSGGGGGVVILSSQAPVSTWPTVYAAGGGGGLNSVPEAVAVSGTGTTIAKATLGVTGGALSGTCTVVTAGAGYGAGSGVTWSILGGGGTAGTATVNPTWSGGALASCTVTPGTSSGYTASTFTTSGNGGDGGAGWFAEFAGW